MDKPFRTAGKLMRRITKGNEEKYFTHDLKHTMVDKETGEMIAVPGREDSYEQFLKAEKQLAEETEKIIVNYRPFIYWLSTWRGDN